MDETKKLLQAILKGQEALKQELLGRINQVENKLTNRINGLVERMDDMEKRLTERIDRIGKRVAYLEDDTPTREEFDGLEKRVHKLEQKVPQS